MRTVGLVVYEARDWSETNAEQCRVARVVLDKISNVLWSVVCPVRGCQGKRNHLCYRGTPGGPSKITSMRLVPHWERFHALDPKRFPSRRELRALLAKLRLCGRL